MRQHLAPPSPILFLFTFAAGFLGILNPSMCSILEVSLISFPTKLIETHLKNNISRYVDE